MWNSSYVITSEGKFGVRGEQEPTGLDSEPHWRFEDLDLMSAGFCLERRRVSWRPWCLGLSPLKKISPRKLGGSLLGVFFTAIICLYIGLYVWWWFL